jgi:hypothetical protein
MAKQKKNPEKPKDEDLTLPNVEKSASLAEADQKKAEAQGEANPPPSATAPKTPMKETLKKEAPKDDGRPKVSLRVFIASGGMRWDQMAGFKSYAMRNKMGPLSIPEWREAFNAFQKRPV